MSLSIKDGNGNAQNIAVTNAGGQLTSWSQPSDGTNPITKTFDLDSSGVTHEWNLCVGLRQSASGGSVEVGTSGHPLRIDPTGTTTQPANLAQVGGTNTDTNSGNKSAGTLRVVIATDQPQLTNKLLVTPDSVALPAHQSVNVDQLNGTTIDTNSGTKSAGTLRVVIATDQPQLTNKLLVTPDSVALPAHQSCNVDQWNGTTVDTNSGNKSAGTVRVVLATDQPALTNALKVDPSGVTSPVSGTVTANQGTANSLANGWPVQITDLTHTMPTMDAAGRAGYVQVTDGTHTLPTGDAAARPIYVTEVPVSSGGLTIYRVLWPANTTGVSIKGSAGQVYGWYVANTATSWRCMKLYNKATAPTVGTDTPFMTIPLPPSSATNIAFPQGIAMGTGIGIGVTTGVADGDTGAPSANDVIVNIGYN
jgi:hypothetical protein